MTSTQGRSLRIDGAVRFRPGYRYIGFGRSCRVEVVPVLGSEVVNTDKYDLRYVAYQPGQWFIFFSQFGTYHMIENTVETADIAKFVDLAAFQWRQRRTNTFWLMHPMDLMAQREADQLYPFDFDYYPKTGELVFKEPGYVYLVEAVGLNRVRIGWTANPDRRPGELVRHNPYPLNFLALMPGDKVDESHLQFILSEWRLHDDWFELTNNIREYVEHLKRHWRTPGAYPVAHIKNLQEPIGSQGVPL